MKRNYRATLGMAMFMHIAINAAIFFAPIQEPRDSWWFLFANIYLGIIVILIAFHAGMDYASDD